MDPADLRLQREREEIQRRLHEIETQINREENQLKHLRDREAALTTDLDNERASGRAKNLPVTDIGDERAYENPIQVSLTPPLGGFQVSVNQSHCRCGLLPIFLFPPRLFSQRRVPAPNGNTRALLVSVEGM